MKAIIRVLDEDPQFENEPFFPWLFYNLKCMLSGCTAYTRGNLQPVAGTSCDPYVRVKLGKDTETRDHKKKTPSRTSTRPLNLEQLYQVPAELKIQLKDYSVQTCT